MNPQPDILGIATLTVALVAVTAAVLSNRWQLRLERQAQEAVERELAEAKKATEAAFAEAQAAFTPPTAKPEAERSELSAVAAQQAEHWREIANVARGTLREMNLSEPQTGLWAPGLIHHFYGGGAGFLKRVDKRIFGPANMPSLEPSIGVGHGIGVSPDGLFYVLGHEPDTVLDQPIRVVVEKRGRATRASQQKSTPRR